MIAKTKRWFSPRGYFESQSFEIRDGGQVVASCVVHTDGDIWSVKTHPDFQRQGHAERLLRFVIRKMLPRFSKLTLNVYVSNGPAIALYCKLGFRGELYDDRVLGMELTAADYMED